MLKAFDLTPARFDLLTALRHRAVKQSALWRRLQVVRSVVSEMLDALVMRGWVERRRCRKDRRTWVVSLTAYGRELIERAHEKWIATGHVSVLVDSVLVDGLIESDPGRKRWRLMCALGQLMGAFGWRSGARDLYLNDPADYYECFADPTWTQLPFVDQSSSNLESSAETS